MKYKYIKFFCLKMMVSKIDSTVLVNCQIVRRIQPFSLIVRRNRLKAVVTFESGYLPVPMLTQEYVVVVVEGQAV